MDEIVLRLDRETAYDLRNFIHDVGEHIAAGIPLPQLDSEENRRLFAFF